MNTRPARSSRAEAFRAAAPVPDRAGALGGLLPPKPADRPPTALREPPRAPDSAPGPEVPDNPHEAASRPAMTHRPTQPAGDDLDRVRNVAVYLPVELLDQVRRTARSRELTYADLLVEAATAHLTDLGDTDPWSDPAVTSTGQGMPTRQVRGPRSPGVQLQLRLDGHQIAWLDRQVEQLSAPSRTALVLQLLQTHLTTSRQRPDPDIPG